MGMVAEKIRTVDGISREVISDRVLSVWGLTRDGRVQVGRVQPKRDIEVPSIQDQVYVGCKVCIITPDIPKLHNTIGTVTGIEWWGCYLDASAAESGKFRALWSEMVVM